MNPVVRYTRWVMFGKHTLWVLIALILTLVVWTVSDNTSDNGARLVFSNVPKIEAMQNIMLKPNYQGVDADNQPYTVIADKATQLDKDLVELENISADMLRADGKWLALKALQGTLDNKTKKLELEGAVNLFYDGGIEFRTERALVDIQQGTAYGDAPVEGQSPMGRLRADGFEITGRGKSIRFNGSVRMKLYR